LSRAQIFANHPAEIINYQNEPAPLEALKKLAAALSRAGLLVQKNDPRAAIQYFEAEFALGSKLFDERLTAAEMLAGIALMSESAVGLRKACEAAGQRDRVKQIDAFDESRQQLWQSRIEPMLRVLQS